MNDHEMSKELSPKMTSLILSSTEEEIQQLIHQSALEELRKQLAESKEVRAVSIGNGNLTDVEKNLVFGTRTL